MVDHPRANLLMPVLLWSAVQLVALAAGVFRVPLSDGYPRPAEDLAAHLMVTVQVTALAALFPLLLRDGVTMGVVIALLWPYLLIAGFLATLPLSAVAGAGLVVSLWAAALAAWVRPLGGRPASAHPPDTSASETTPPQADPSPADSKRAAPAMGLAISAALLLTLGTATLRYLAAEYRPAVTGGPLHSWWDYTPLLAALGQLTAPSIYWPGLILPLILLIFAAALRLSGRKFSWSA